MKDKCGEVQKSMNITTYEIQFDDILEGRNVLPPYDNPDYIHYVKMNQTRASRLSRKGKLLPQLEELITRIDQETYWLLITEPWCGDAAHCHPFVARYAAMNDHITLKVQNRDTPGSEIDNYLTNGGKSIPMLIVRDAYHRDLFTWGPRPKDAQELYLDLKNQSVEWPEILKQLQLWYSKNKGVMMQEEWYDLFQQHFA